MHIAYRIFISLLSIAIFLTFFSLFMATGTYLLSHNPRAMDFIAFYTGAHILLQSPTEVYNFSTQLLTQQQIDPVTKTQQIFLPFLNPPFVALLFIPFVKLGLQTAYGFWLIINSILLMSICVLSYRQLKPAKWFYHIIFIIGIITFIPILTTLIIGQLSLLLCVIVLLAWIFLKKGKEFYGGFILSLLIIKPHFFILPLLAVILQRRKKLTLGVTTGIGMAAVVSYNLTGGTGVTSYLSLLNSTMTWNSGFGIDLMAQHSLQTAFLILFQTQSLPQIYLPWIISVALIGLPTLFLWTKQFTYSSVQFAYQFSLLIVATLLTSPHTHFHDLSLLVAVAIILLWSISKSNTYSSKKVYVILLIAGYIIELIGYLFDVQTQTATRHLWILISVGYMLLFWFVTVKALIKSQKNIKNRG